MTHGLPQKGRERRNGKHLAVHKVSGELRCRGNGHRRPHVVPDVRRRPDEGEARSPDTEQDQRRCAGVPAPPLSEGRPRSDRLPPPHCQLARQLASQPTRLPTTRPRGGAYAPTSQPPSLEDQPLLSKQHYSPPDGAAPTLRSGAGTSCALLIHATEGHRNGPAPEGRLQSARNPAFRSGSWK